MKRIILSLILSALCVPLVFAQTCPPQSYPAIPATVDMNQVSYDHDGTDLMRPAPQKLLLRSVKLVLGQSTVITGWSCDEDGDSMHITAEKGQLALGPDGGWKLAYTPTAIGVEYFDVTATDVRDTGDSKSTTGTIHVVTIPRNHEPHIGCGG